MATVQNTTFAGASLKARFDATVASLMEAAKRRKVYKTTFNELSELSNRELADLGIARSHIRRIALDASQDA